MEQLMVSSRFLIVSLVLIFNSVTIALASLSHRENYTVYVQRSRSECRNVCLHDPWSLSWRFPYVLCRHSLDRRPIIPCHHRCVTIYESVPEIRTRCAANWTGSNCDIRVCSNCSNCTGCSAPDNDVDECAAGTSGCSQLCNNSIGSYTCGCNPGYRLAPNGKACYDVNECSTRRSGCAQLCNNTIGSFTCGCNPGYRLAPNGKSCYDVNECSTRTSGCAQLCYNSFGSFNCGCNPGYSLAANGKSCSSHEVTDEP